MQSFRSADVHQNLDRYLALRYVLGLESAQTTDHVLLDQAP